MTRRAKLEPSFLQQYRDDSSENPKLDKETATRKLYKMRESVKEEEKKQITKAGRVIEKVTYYKYCMFFLSWPDFHNDCLKHLTSIFNF